jgi:uncharacterized protein DUF3105
MVENPAPGNLAPPSPPPLSTLTTRPVSRSAATGGASVGPPVPVVFVAPPAALPIPPAHPAVPAARKAAAPARQRVVVRGLAVVLGLVALSVLAWFVFDPLGTDGVSPVQTFPEQGRIHIAPGQPHPAYNSIPATSGWHREEFPPTHILTAPIEDEVSVHVLEHGNVFIFYDCSSGGCDQLRSQLTAVVQTELDLRAGEGVYMAPYRLPNGHKIALAAWTHLQYLDKLKESVIRAFCDTYLGVMNESKPVVPPTP